MTVASPACACGKPLPPKAPGSPGRPPKKCLACQALKARGEYSSAPARTAAKKRAARHAKVKKRAVKAAITAQAMDELGRFAAALSFIADPQAAACYAGINVADADQLAGMVSEAKRLHGDLVAADARKLSRRIVATIGRLAHELHVKAGLIAPQYLAHALGSLAKAHEVLAGGEQVSSYATINFSVLGADGKPRSLLRTKPETAS